MEKSKNLLRRTWVILFALVIAVFAFAVGCGHDNGDPTEEPIPEGGVRIYINYYRPDNNFDGWNMWLWPTGAEGKQYDFTGTKNTGDYNWATLYVTLDSVKTDADGNIMGLIIRKGEWSAKDVDVDRFLPASEIKDQKLNVYLLSGIETIYYSEEAAMSGIEESTKIKISEARFMEFDRVYIETSAKITNKSHFKIKDSTGKVFCDYDCSLDANKGSIGKTFVSLRSEEEMDIKETYTVYDEPETFDDEVNFRPCEVAKYTAYNTERFNELYAYDGVLGAEYSASQTKFTVWSPYAKEMKLNIYSAGEGGVASTYDMTAGSKGIWTYTLDGDQNGKYYTYTVINGNNKSEVVDPYARSGGKNGQRGMILDLNATNPTGWATQSEPTLASNSNAVIWEAQLRDVTIHQSSGVSEANRGKFLGLTETGTKNSKGRSTALDYLKDLGVTEVHFQPLFDFASVDESFTAATYDKYGEYNWGYDPLNYNMPEGSYSSDPSNGTKRVNEMKQMVMALHNAGIQVIMDVVYNHVSNAQSSNFEKLMPGYYFRMTNTGTYYNGSGCGNETASERAMFRKFMIDSVLYWTQEYKIDGFRFDLMGLHDIVTMNELYDALKKVNPDVVVYGEGWTGGTSGLGANDQAVLANAKKMPNIAFFNDSVRDGLKGSVFTMSDTGFVSGKASSDSAVYYGATGGSDKFASPTQNINYTACHDNSLLWDKLNASVKGDADTLKAMNRLAAVAVLTGQGIAFIPAGEEMMRSKPTTATNDYDNRPNAYLNDPNYYFADNSYKSPDSVNAINWDLLDENADMVSFYKALIAIKTSFAQFTLSTAEQIANCVIADKDSAKSDGIAVYAVKDPSSDEYAIVILNNNATAKTVGVPQGAYSVYVNGANANATTALSSFNGASVEVGAYSAIVMKATLTADAVSAWTYSVA